MNKSRLLVLMFLITVALLINGCNKLRGSYEYRYEGGFGVEKYVITFEKKGSCTAKYIVPFFPDRSNGKYQINGKNIQFDFEDSSLGAISKMTVNATIEKKSFVVNGGEWDGWRFVKIK